MRILQVIQAPSNLRVCYAQEPTLPGGTSYVTSPLYYLALVEEVWDGVKSTSVYALDLVDGGFEVVIDTEYCNFVGIGEEGKIPEFIEESARNYLAKRKK